MNLSQAILVFVVLAPGVVFGVLALLWLLGWAPSERSCSRITGLTFSACAVGVAALVWKHRVGVKRTVGGDLRQLVCGAIITISRWY